MKATVRITREDTEIVCDLGSAVAQISDGFGGWEQVDRPDDVSLTEWNGQGPLRMTLPLMLDGFRHSVGVQRDLDRLLRLGRTKHTDEPPSFRVHGPVPFSGTRWVMEATPEFGDTIRSADGRLIRQALTLSLMEYVRPDRVKIRRPKAKTYTTRKGDTLMSIARKLRPHDSGAETIKYAKQLGAANKIRDIRRKLEAGKRLRLP